MKEIVRKRKSVEERIGAFLEKLQKLKAQSSLEERSKLKDIEILNDLGGEIFHKLLERDVDVLAIGVHGSALNGEARDVDFLAIVSRDFDPALDDDCIGRDLANEIGEICVGGKMLEVDISTVGIFPHMEKFDIRQVIPWNLLQHEIIYNQSISEEMFDESVNMARKYVRKFGKKIDECTSK